ncbi:hypothetical protein PTTG_04271 [Puccinia triticina 1-1 BBBD Race 1]|uniref:Uncharacterized protein n=1 Tax=Puccinia triticina (isolate 1-1 / race 1 (BBBD)) TaxID=630390 RepID=A0A0C4ETZ2_PUCT1|nr:hypothetical protein PTTG_04271 [Puccinia triticina 1-1 BBBD Race 1]
MPQAHPPGPATRVKQTRRPSSQAITRMTQVRTGGTPNITPSRIITDTPNITPSRIITDTGGQSGESGGPMPPPTIGPTPTRAPVITPSRIINSTGPHTGKRLS